MWSLTKIVGLVILPLMIGSAVLGSLSTIQTTAVEENYGVMDALLEREQNKFVIDQKVIDDAEAIGAGFNSPEPEAEVFRDVIAVSQLSALSCDKTADLISGRIYLAMVNENKVPADEIDGSSEPGFTTHVPEPIQEALGEEVEGPGGGQVKQYEVTPWHAFPGRPVNNPSLERAPNYALQLTEYTPRCVGVQRAESALPDAGVLTDPLGYVGGGIVDTFHPVNVWNELTCSTVPSWVEQAGNDMEGRYGRVPFEISEDLNQPVVLGWDKPGDLSRGMVWQANFINSVQTNTDCFAGKAFGAVISGTVALTAGGITTVATGGNAAAGAMVGLTAGSVVAATEPGWGNDIKLIPTMAGGQFATYAPYKVDIIEGDANWPGINLAHGHVVVDAPVVLENGEGPINSESQGADRATKFQKEAKYVLCPGTSGYIQTNRDNNGRGGGEHVPPDDEDDLDIDTSKITTYIRVTGGNRESCVDDGSNANYVQIDSDVTIRYYDEINMGDDN